MKTKNEFSRRVNGVRACVIAVMVFCVSAYCETGCLAGNFYLSTKYQISLMSSAVGGNVEFSYVGPGRFGGFLGVDFGGGGKVLDTYVPRIATNGGDFGGGLSFGAKIQPVDWFTAVLGGSGGFWEFIKRQDYVDFGGGGPFLKLLFGSKRIRYELSSRVIFGTRYEPVTQIATGVTFALGKKDK